MEISVPKCLESYQSSVAQATDPPNDQTDEQTDPLKQ